MPQLYWDTIELGDPVTPLSKPAVTRVQIAKFAGAAQDWSPLHIDDDFAKSAGYGSVFAHGAISLGFAVEAVQKWLENGRVQTTTSTFQKLVWPGDILTAKGVVVNRYEKNGEARVDVDVWAENQNHDIVMKGQITCVLWRNDKDEKKGKGTFPPVAPETIKERRTAKPVPKNDAEAMKARQEAAQQTAQTQHAAEMKKGARPAPRPAAPPPPAKAAPPPPPAKPAAKPAAPPPPPPKKAAPPPPPPPAKPAAKPTKAAPPPPPPKKAAPPPPKKPEPKKPAPKPAEPKKPEPKKAPKPPPKPAPKPAAKKPAPAPAKKPAKPPPKPAPKKKK